MQASRQRSERSETNKVTENSNSSPDVTLVSSTLMHAAAKLALNPDHLPITITLGQTVELSNTKNVTRILKLRAPNSVSWTEGMGRKILNKTTEL